MTNAYSPYLKEKQSHLYIEYTNGLYKVMERIRTKYPHLPIMLVCTEAVAALIMAR